MKHCFWKINAYLVCHDIDTCPKEKVEKDEQASRIQLHHKFVTNSNSTHVHWGLLDIWRLMIVGFEVVFWNNLPPLEINMHQGLNNVQCSFHFKRQLVSKPNNHLIFSKYLLHSRLEKPHIIMTTKFWNKSNKKQGKKESLWIKKIKGYPIRLDVTCFKPYHSCWFLPYTCYFSNDQFKCVIIPFNEFLFSKHVNLMYLMLIK